MSINSFPPELLTIVLSNEKITLKQRIALRAVSSHWREVIEEHVLKKKTTELMLGYYKNDGIESNRLPCKDELIPLLIRLFPKLINLSVSASLKAPCKALQGLLTPLSTTLTTLKLDLDWMYRHFEDPDPDPQSILDLTTAINALTSLTTLHLDHVHNAADIVPQLLPTLIRLQQFHFDDQSDFDLYLTYPPADFWQKITANTSLPNLTTLEIEQFSDDYVTTVADLVATFPALQSLKLHLHPKDWLYAFPEAFFRHITSLQSLTELNLVNLLPMFFGYDEPLPLPLPTDQRLTQVKKLTCTHSCSIEEVTTIIVAWFPSLEVLHLHDQFEFGGSHSASLYLTDTTLQNLARLEQLVELVLSNDYSNICVLDYPAPPQPTERPIIGLKRLDLLLGEHYGVEEPICTSALVAWFPSLEYLKLRELYDEIDHHHPRNLTTVMLRDIGQLKNLVELELPRVMYKMEHLEPPLSDDRPLICWKVLKLEIAYPMKDFDASYFCSTVTAWFPALEVLNIKYYYDEDNAEDYEMYKTVSEVIRKRFDSLVKLDIN